MNLHIRIMVYLNMYVMIIDILCWPVGLNVRIYALESTFQPNVYITRLTKHS